MTNQRKQDQAVSVTRKRIYIAGPMTGLPDYNRVAFLAAAGLIEAETDLVPIHTAWLRDGLTWEEYMELAYEFLGMCDLICLLPGWEQSRGAQRELELALDAGVRRVDLDKVVEEFGR